MIKNLTNFVLNKILKRDDSLKRTDEGVRTIRYPRLRKFKKKGKTLAVASQLVAIWYILILTGSYLTTDTGAYFNDVEIINGTISVAEDFCEGVKPGTDYWHKYCKDNAGLGNGSEASDKGTDEKGKDQDNPGNNKGGCDDHTNAPCSEVIDLKEKHTSNSVNLSWSNPNQGNKNFSHVKVYRYGDSNPVGDNIKNGKFEDRNLVAATGYSYKITTVDKSGNESTGVTIEVTTDP